MFLFSVNTVLKKVLINVSHLTASSGGRRIKLQSTSLPPLVSVSQRVGKKDYDWPAVVVSPIPLSLLPLTPLEVIWKSRLWVWTVRHRDWPRDWHQISGFRRVDREDIPYVVCRNDLTTKWKKYAIGNICKHIKSNEGIWVMIVYNASFSKFSKTLKIKTYIFKKKEINGKGISPVCVMWFRLIWGRWVVPMDIGSAYSITVVQMNQIMEVFTVFLDCLSTILIGQTWNSVSSTGYNYSKKKREKKKLKIHYR